MKISVIIPVFNAENFLLRAIESVLIQPEVTELILVDDGSTDSSLQICMQQAEMDKRILILQHSANKNKGVSATRNLGILNATETFIAFLDADDYYLHGRFSATSLIFDADETIDGVYEMIGVQSGEKIQNYSVIQKVEPDELFDNLQPLGNKVWFSIDGLTVKKSIFDKSGLFEPSLTTSEDTFQWFKMAANAKLVAGNILHPVTITDRRKGSLTSDINLVNYQFINMLTKLLAFCKNNDLAFSRKELVLEKLYFYSLIKYPEVFSKRFMKYSLLWRIVIADIGFVLFRSKVFRRYIGNIIGYNNFIQFVSIRKPI